MTASTQPSGTRPSGTSGRGGDTAHRKVAAEPRVHAAGLVGPALMTGVSDNGRRGAERDRRRRRYRGPVRRVLPPPSGRRCHGARGTARRQWRLLGERGLGHAGAGGTAPGAGTGRVRPALTVRAAVA